MADTPNPGTAGEAGGMAGGSGATFDVLHFINR